MKQPLLIELGMGSSLRRQDYTEAACRAVRDALWRHSINLAELFGCDKADMILDVEIGVQQPGAVDSEKVAALFPYGQPSVTIVKGGLDVPRPMGNPTVIANAAITVSLPLEEAGPV